MKLEDQIKIQAELVEQLKRLNLNETNRFTENVKNLIDKVSQIDIPGEIKVDHTHRPKWWKLIHWYHGILFALIVLSVVFIPREVELIQRLYEIKKLEKEVRKDARYLKAIEPFKNLIKVDNEGWRYIEIRNNNVSKNKDIESWIEFDPIYNEKRYITGAKIYLGKE